MQAELIEQFRFGATRDRPVDSILLLVLRTGLSAMGNNIHSVAESVRYSTISTDLRFFGKE
jgi:hypothetical protein